MGLNSYVDDNSPMIEYKFRFIGEQICAYTRLNAYESDDVWYADVEFFHPIEKRWRKEQFTATGRQVTRKDIVDYIDRLIDRHHAYVGQIIKEERFTDLLYRFKNDEAITLNECRELIELFMDEDIRRSRLSVL